MLKPPPRGRLRDSFHTWWMSYSLYTAVDRPQSTKSRVFFLLARVRARWRFPLPMGALGAGPASSGNRRGRPGGVVFRVGGGT